jgi:hypothetical protein
MVLLRFTATSLSRGYQPSEAAARRVDNYKDPTQGVHSQRDKPLLTLGVRIFDG